MALALQSRTSRAVVSTRKSVKTQAVLKKSQLPVKVAPPKKGTGKVSPAAKAKTPPPFGKLGFTKSNELLVSRLAMLGFASALIGEVITGQGALAQFGYETGLSLSEVDDFILALIAFNFVAAVLPTSQTFKPEEQEALETRPKGSLQDPSITILTPKKFFGISGWGFSKENELFVGRLAQLGFAASLLGEAITGKGPLAQFDLETGIPLWETEAGLLVLIGLLLFAAVNPGTGSFQDDETPL